MEVARRLQKSLLSVHTIPNVYCKNWCSLVLNRNFRRAPVYFPHAARDHANSSTAYIAIGSNAGGTARLQMVEKAMELMGQKLGKIVACSCLYETLPGYDIAPGLPAEHNMYLPLYLNAVIQLISEVHDPQTFLSFLQDIERDCGRNRHLEADNVNKRFERSLDLDLLLFKRPGEGFFRCESEHLTLPHPRSATRNFVLFPLSDIDPFLVHPTEMLTVKELIFRLVEKRRNKLSSGKLQLQNDKNVPVYSIDGGLAIPRRCFTLDGKHLWTARGFEASVGDTLRWISEVKQRFQYDCDCVKRYRCGGILNSHLNEHLKAAEETVSVLSELESTLHSEPLVRIMGVLNVTPDSFSDGNLYFSSTESAVKAAVQMRDFGADVIDVGGEATNPYVTADVTVQEECKRVVSVIECIRSSLKDDVVLSVDTRRLEVAQAAMAAGANMVNDITAGESDHRILDFVASKRFPIVLMHSRGCPKTMDKLTDYKDVVVDVALSLRKSVESLIRQGLPRWRILVDVGFGFGKCHEQCMEIVRRMRELERWLPLGIPIVLGYSRKRFIGWAMRGEGIPKNSNKAGTKGAACLDSSEIHDRDVAGTVLACWAMAQKCGVAVLRVHDVRLTALVRNVMHKIISPRIRKGSALDLDVHRVYPTPEERTREATELEKSKDDQA